MISHDSMQETSLLSSVFTLIKIELDWFQNAYQLLFIIVTAYTNFSIVNANIQYIICYCITQDINY